MDPAEPDFKDHPTAVRLDKHDAAFVDVIHTNGAPITSGIKPLTGNTVSNNPERTFVNI